MTDETMVSPQDAIAEELRNMGIEPDEKQLEDNKPNDDSKPPAEADNDEETPPKQQELKQKLTASKNEALKLKAERDRLQTELSKISKQKSQGKTPSISSEDADQIKETLKSMGVAFKGEVVEKQEVYQEKVQSKIDQFTKEFPEYNKPGDADSDAKWQELQSEFSLYRTPKSPEETYQFLKRAHDDIKRRTEVDSTFERGKSLGYAKANLADKASVGGSGSGSPAPRKKSAEQSLIEQELGVSDIDIA